MTCARLPLALVLTVALGAGLAAACGIDDILIGAPCEEDADCPNLSCVRTATEEASGEPGLCSESERCIPGQQEGCQAASDGTCEFTFTSVEGPDGVRYCCGIGTNAMVISVAEDGTAECFDCPTCSGNEEPCRAGEDRCVTESDAPCGCRPPEGALLDAVCASDEDCGSLTCVRTLEQLEEPQEPTVPAQALEDGQCRDDGECAPGQSGCLVPATAGCSASTEVVGIDSLEYCCPSPGDTSNFRPLAYAVSADQGEVACTVCERRACFDVAGNPNIDECTTVSDPACEVNAGQLCGCPPT